MSDDVQVVVGEDEVEAFLEALSIGPDELEVARTSLWQLGDFEFGRVVYFPGDVEVGRGEDMFSASWLAARGVDTSGGARTLVVVEGSIVAEGHISLSEDYCIVRGNVSSEVLYVDGEALFVCFGTVTARYIESSYNGTISCIRRAVADFVFLSSDEVLRILEIDPGTMLLAGSASDIEEDLFIEGMLERGAPTQVCKETIARGDAVLRLEVHEILRQVARMPTDVRGASEALARVDGIHTFRFWDGGRADATVLHALAEVESGPDELRAGIASLVAAGVPLDHEGRKLRFGKGVGTALHVAIVAGLETTAAAFVAEGAQVDTGGGRLLNLILGPLESMAKYPERSTGEQRVRLVERSRAAISIAKAHDYRVIAELEAVGKRLISKIEAAISSKA